MKTITLEKKMTVENVVDKKLAREMMSNAVEARDFWIRMKNSYLNKIENIKSGN